MIQGRSISVKPDLPSNEIGNRVGIDLAIGIARWVLTAVIQFC